jgi:predicted TPR repeat methyltransferase
MPLLEKHSSMDDLPAAMRGLLLACARCEMPANIALMHLCMAAPDASDVEDAILRAQKANASAHELEQLLALWRQAPQAFALVKQILSTIDHGNASGAPEAMLAECAAAFDRAAKLSPEASVALYSLGDPVLLAAATGEIVHRMREWGLLGRQKTALEIGCGNGRFLAALAGDLGHVTGVDISAAMIAGARERCAHLRNVEAHHTEGRDLRFCADASMDLILAADSFAYIVRCGPELVMGHFREAARVLRPEGRFLILNYSYRGDLDQDRAEIIDHAAMTGFALERMATRDFKLWDGVTFLLRKRQA